MPPPPLPATALRDRGLAEAIRRIWFDPLAFGEALGYRGDPSTGRKKFGAFHHEMLSHVHSQPRTSTVVPRGHAKSTLITVVDTCHHLLHHPESRNLIACATLDLARKLVGEIRDRLRGDLELLPGVYLPVREVFPWLATAGDPRRSGPCDQFNILGRTAGKGRESSVFAASIESNLAGNHPTRAVIDDPVNEQNSRTFSRRKKVIDFIEALEPLMYDHDSPINHIGTPWAFQDVTTYLERRPDWSQFRFGVWDGPPPADAAPDATGPGPDGGWPLCPSFLTATEIKEKEASLSRTFYSAQYLCAPVPSEEALFEPALLTAATDSAYPTVESLPDGPEVLLFDPVARIDGTKGDLNGLVVIRVLPAAALGLKGFPPERNIFIPVFAHEIAGGADAAACWIENEGVPRFKPRLTSIWIEQVASQSLFAPWLEERGRISGIKIRGQKIGVSSLPFRLMSLQTAMRKGYLFFPGDFPGKKLLFRRLAEYPLGDSDDLISALALLSTMVDRRGSLPGLPDAPHQDWSTSLWSSQKTRNRPGYWPSN